MAGSKAGAAAAGAVAAGFSGSGIDGAGAGAVLSTFAPSSAADFRFLKESPASILFFDANTGSAGASAKSFSFSFPVLSTGFAPDLDDFLGGGDDEEEGEECSEEGDPDRARGRASSPPLSSSLSLFFRFSFRVLVVGSSVAVAVFVFAALLFFGAIVIEQGCKLQCSQLRDAPDANINIIQTGELL